MKKKLLDYLACPSCEGPIRLISVAEQDGIEIMEGELECAACRRTFAIHRGIPRFVNLSQVEPDKAATAENFGWSWQHFSQMGEHYKAQFLGWMAPVKPEFFENKVVLEGGCGKGRHTQLVARFGARDVVAVDLSDAVEVAFAATRQLENAHIIQADMYQLPVRRIFDFAFSLGVLHHLPDPRAGFIALASKVKPGGHLSAWIYGAENNGWIKKWINPLRERLTSRMNRSALLYLSKLPAAALYLATKLVYGPLNRVNRGPRPTAMARHLFYNDYLSSISAFDWSEHHSIVFDHLIAPTAFYIPREEFEEWWREIKAADVVIGWHNKNSWRGFGKLID